MYTYKIYVYPFILCTFINTINLLYFLEYICLTKYIWHSLVQTDIRNAKRSIEHVGISTTNNSHYQMHNTGAFFALLLFGKATYYPNVDWKKLQQYENSSILCILFVVYRVSGKQTSVLILRNNKGHTLCIHICIDLKILLFRNLGIFLFWRVV